MYLLSCCQHNFCGVTQIVEIHLLHLLAESFILDHDIQFPISKPARNIEIGGTYPGPPAVDDSGLGVQHRAIPFK